MPQDSTLIQRSMQYSTASVANRAQRNVWNKYEIALTNRLPRGGIPLVSTEMIQ